MGRTILRKHIADAFVGSPRAAFRHVITFGGHPVAAAASLKNLEIMEREGMVENSARMGKYLLDGLEELKQKHSIIGNVRGLGSCADWRWSRTGRLGAIPGGRRPWPQVDPGPSPTRASSCAAATS